MSGEKQKVVARIGNKNALAQAMLTLGEMGWIKDDKIFALGDDTPSSPLLATTKSTGFLEFYENLTIKYGEIQLHNGKKIDGVDPSQLIQANGFTAYRKVQNPDNPADTAVDLFFNRTIEGSEYITVENSDGAYGNPTIKPSDALITLITNAAKGIDFTAGINPPPSNSKGLGSIFYDTEEDVLYMNLSSNTDPNTRQWVDFISFGGGGSIKFHVGPSVPQNAALGDYWSDTDEDAIYQLIADQTGFHWVQRRL